MNNVDTDIHQCLCQIQIILKFDIVIFNDLETKTFDKYMDKDNPVISNALNQRHLQCVVCIHIPGKQCTGTLIKQTC